MFLRNLFVHVTPRSTTQYLLYVVCTWWYQYLLLDDFWLARDTYVDFLASTCQRRRRKKLAEEKATALRYSSKAETKQQVKNKNKIKATHINLHYIEHTTFIIIIIIYYYTTA